MLSQEQQLSAVRNPEQRSGASPIRHSQPRGLGLCQVAVGSTARIPSQLQTRYISCCLSCWQTTTLPSGLDRHREFTAVRDSQHIRSHSSKATHDRAAANFAGQAAPARTNLLLCLTILVARRLPVSVILEEPNPTYALALPL